MSLRKLAAMFCLMLTSAVLMNAQESSKVEVFGGYQYTNVSDGTDRYNFNGWNAALTSYVHKNVGFTADLSGGYGSPFATNFRVHSFLFGPTVRVPLSKATPFAHVLLGVSHVGADTAPSFTDSAFAYAVGGGVDVNAGRHLALRLAQLDYLGTRFNEIDFGSSNQNHFRLSTGLVFRF